MLFYTPRMQEIVFRISGDSCGGRAEAACRRKKRMFLPYTRPAFRAGSMMNIITARREIGAQYQLVVN